MLSIYTFCSWRYRISLAAFSVCWRVPCRLQDQIFTLKPCVVFKPSIWSLPLLVMHGPTLLFSIKSTSFWTRVYTNSEALLSADKATSVLSCRYSLHVHNDMGCSHGISNPRNADPNQALLWVCLLSDGARWNFLFVLVPCLPARNPADSIHLYSVCHGTNSCEVNAAKGRQTSKSRHLSDQADSIVFFRMASVSHSFLDVRAFDQRIWLREWIPPPVQR